MGASGKPGAVHLNILVGSHADLERLLKGYNQAYNARRQRVLKGLSPDEVVRRRLNAKPDLANPRYISPDPKGIQAAMRVVASAKQSCNRTTRS